MRLTLHGKTYNSCTPLRHDDGATLIKDYQGIPQQWVKHLEELCDCVNHVDTQVFEQHPTSPKLIISILGLHLRRL